MADINMNASFPKANQAGIEFVISTNKELQENIMFLSNEFPIAMFTQSYHHATSDHIPFHWHDGLQITWVYEGELEHCINGDTFHLTGDKLLFVNSHQLHRSKTVHQDAKTLCINFSQEIFQPQILKKLILPLLENPSFPYTLLPLKPHQTALLKQFLNWKNEPLGYFSVMNFLSQIFEIMLNEFEESKDPSNYEEMKLFHTILDYVHSQYAEPLTVKQIADHVLINKNRLTGLFKKYTNMPPLKYLNEYRLYIAKNIIIHTDKSISEISADVGYNQISHFIKQFRNSYGLSPLKYRNKYGEHQNLPKVW
nr:AraC family transcriptional regulator [uncultured Clostridium sp.]